MSTEDESELKELVVQALEASGVLAQIRAQLRASVFLALEEATAPNSKKPTLNGELREYLSTPKGKKTAHLIREFFQFFNMKSTLSVFDSESFFGQVYDDDSKKSVFNEANNSDKRRPLLDVIVHRSIDTCDADPALAGNLCDVPSKPKKWDPIVGTVNVPLTPAVDPFFDEEPASNEWPDNFTKNMSSTLRATNDVSASSVGKNEELKPSSSVTAADHTEQNILGLAESVGSLNIGSKNGTSKPMNEFYDEDFQSSLSLQSNQKTENDLSSEGEIEESLSEIGDELSVNSDAQSQDQNSTVDNSVSQLCGKADYTESIK